MQGGHRRSSPARLDVCLVRPSKNILAEPTNEHQFIQVERGTSIWLYIYPALSRPAAFAHDDNIINTTRNRSHCVTGSHPHAPPSRHSNPDRNPVPPAREHKISNPISNQTYGRPFRPIFPALTLVTHAARRGLTAATLTLDLCKKYPSI